MAELTQLKDKSALNVQKIESTADSSDAFSKIFGDVGALAQKETLSLLDEHSEVSLLQSKNALQDTITGAKINLLHNPDMAEKINQDTKQVIDSIVKGAYVNDKHRKQLTELANTYSNQSDLLSAQTGYKQSIKDTQLSIDIEFPKSLQTINDLYLQNRIDEAHQMQDGLIKSIQMAFKANSISAKKYASLNLLVQDTIDRAEKTRQMAAKGDATAADYHEQMTPIYGTGSNDRSNWPANEYTSHNADYYDGESSKQKAIADVHEHGYLPNPAVMNGLKPDAHKVVYDNWAGSNEVWSNINSGTNQIAMMDLMKRLESKGKDLSLFEQGQLGALKSFYRRLENGDFLNVIQQTTQGQRIQNESIANARAIQNNAQYSNDQKSVMLRQNADNEKQQYINLWEGLHGDPQYVKLMKPMEMAPYKQAFVLGGDPDLLIKSIRGTDPSLMPYIADAMPESHQQAVVSMIWQAGNSLSQGLASDMVYANQKDFVPKIVGDKESGAPTIKKIDKLLTVNNDVANALKYINILPYDPKLAAKKGSNVPRATIESLRNTVIFQAERAGDYSVNQASKYINKMGVNLAHAYDIYTDTHGIFNRSTLKLDDHSLSSISSYATSEAYNHLKETMPITEFMDLVDRQPLMAVNTPNNHIAVINSVTGQLALDKKGHPLFDKPYTENMLSAAKHHVDQENYANYLKILRKEESHPFGKTFQ